MTVMDREWKQVRLLIVLGINQKHETHYFAIDSHCNHFNQLFKPFKMNNICKCIHESCKNEISKKDENTMNNEKR